MGAKAPNRKAPQKKWGQTAPPIVCQPGRRPASPGAISPRFAGGVARALAHAGGPPPGGRSDAQSPKGGQLHIAHGALCPSPRFAGGVPDPRGAPEWVVMSPLDIKNHCCFGPGRAPWGPSGAKASFCPLAQQGGKRLFQRNNEQNGGKAFSLKSSARLRRAKGGPCFSQHNRVLGTRPTRPFAERAGRCPNLGRWATSQRPRSLQGSDYTFNLVPASDVPLRMRGGAFGDW